MQSPESPMNRAFHGFWQQKKAGTKPAQVGADVHKGFDKNAGTVQSYFKKRTFFTNPLLRYNVFAKEDFAL